MVDVKLQPREFSKRGGGLNVPQFGDVPSLRNLPGVRDVGTEAQAQALISMADDSKRLEQLSGEQFDIHIKEVRADQAIEAEKVYANSLVGITEGVENIRQNEENTELIPEKTLEFYDNASSDISQKTEGLSSYQKKVLEDKFNQYRMNVASNAIQYQANLRAVERENDVAEILQSTSLFLYNNPGELDNRMASLGATLRDEAGLSGTQVESQVLKAQGDLAVTAISGLSQKDPYLAIQKINRGDYDTYLDGKSKASALQFAEREKNAREAKYERSLANREKQMAIDVQNRIYMANDFSIPEDERPEPYTQQEIIDMGFGFETTRKLISLSEDRGEDSPEVLYDIQQTVRRNPLEAEQKLVEAVETNQISRETYRRLESRINSNLEGERRVSPLERSIRLIEDVQTESALSKFPMLSLSVSNASSELQLRVDEYDKKMRDMGKEPTPAERNNFIRQETLSVMKENFPAELFKLSVQIPSPYKNTVQRNSITSESLSQSKKQLFMDEAQGLITESRLKREVEKIRQWEEYLLSKENVNGTINSAR